MEFLRRVLQKHLRGEEVLPDAFRCRPERDEKLSVTLRRAELSSEDAIDAYQRSTGIKSGFPGIVLIRTDQLQAVGLCAEAEADDADPVYGHLHHVIVCPNPDQAARLAKFASENRILRAFLKRT